MVLSHPNIFDGWFKETTALWPGQAMSLQVAEILHVEKSLYQDVLVFQSTSHGNVLVLDGVIQVSERDEFAYQEMITHLPLMAHPCPKKILVVGGGDGGVLREVVKHADVESVTLVEIDEAVIRVSKTYLPAMAIGFQHPKTTVHVGDGAAYLRDNVGEYDVIITDSTDPVGPAESLFQDSFFELMRKSLKPGGIVCTQGLFCTSLTIGECMWLHLELMKKVVGNAQNMFPSVSYAWASVPTYPSGQIGFVLCGTAEGVEFDKPREVELEGCRYYNQAIHRAAFVLPKFCEDALAIKSTTR